MYSNSNAEILSPFEGKSEFLRLNGRDKWLETECLNPVNGNKSCRNGAALRVSKFYFKKEYVRSRNYLGYFWLLHKDNYGEANCPKHITTTSYTPEDIGYFFGYWQARYALDVAQNIDTKESGVKAFLCSLLDIGYKHRQNMSDFRFNRANFRLFIQEKFPNEPDMDPDTFLSEIQEPTQAVYNKVAGDFVWGKDWRKDTAVHVKLSELYKNSGKHCEKIGLSSIYCNFMNDLSAQEARIAKDLAKDGHIE